MNINDYELLFSMNIGYFSYSTWWWPLITSEMKTLNIISIGKLNGQTDTAFLWTLLGPQADHLLLRAQVSLALFLSLCLIWTPHHCSFPFSLLIELAAQMTETKKGSSWYNSIQTGEEVWQPNSYTRASLKTPLLALLKNTEKGRHGPQPQSHSCQATWSSNHSGHQCLAT